MLMRRWHILFIVFCIAFGFLTLRLAWLSLAEGESLAARASNQRTHKVDYYQYGRGDFLDTHGRPITGYAAPCLVAFPAMIQDENTLAQELAALLELKESLVLGKLAAAESQGQRTVVLKSNLSQEEISLLDLHKPLGISVLNLSARYQGLRAIHLLGYLEAGERAGEYRGKSGLELRYDAYLQGKSGPQVAALVDERGRQLPGNGFVLLPGQGADKAHNIALTLDLDFQQKAEEALEGFEGAAVVLDIQNGDILAMASTPAVDPYGLEELPGDDAYVNKAISYYPPASTFKILLATAALEEGLPLKEDFICTGSYTLSNGRAVKCWYEEGHGQENIGQALANSCNAYFVDLGLALGGDTIKKYISLFGLDEQAIAGYALEDEDAENIDFSSRVEGDIANISVGEKGISLSPLQIAQMLAVIANGGQRIYPRLVKEIINPYQEPVQVFPSQEPKQIISSNTARRVGEMLQLAVEEGTGSRAGLSGVASAGKTGTTQHKGVWFAGFAPLEQPRWSVAVYIEGGSAGGREGAQVFAEIIGELAVLRGLEGAGLP